MFFRLKIWLLRVWRITTAPGTKTLLFGTHQFILHPIFVLAAWLILYGSWPKFYELCAIVTHDLGYWGQPNIDGPEGERHPKIIADIWHDGIWKEDETFRMRVAQEILGHSRFYANSARLPISKLFYADKLAVSLYPNILYLLLGTLSGEINEYIKRNQPGGKYNHFKGRGKLQWWLVTKSKMCLMSFGEYGRTPAEIQSGVESKG